MGTLDSTVTVTLELPRELYERVAEVAARTHRTPEEELKALAAASLNRQQSAREAWEALSASYRARLEREGKLNQTDDEIFAELAAIREEVANEFYPD